MKSILTRIARFWSEEHSLTAFLVLLVVEIFVIAPLKRTGLVIGIVNGIVNGIVFSLLFLSGLGTISRHKLIQTTGVIFVVLAVSVRWARDVFGASNLEIVDGLLMLTCLIGFLVIVLRHVYREGPVTSHRIQGAVAGYLLLSMIFAVAYNLVDTLQPGSFQISNEQGQAVADLGRAFYYFSVITLTTTGFGDITALNHYARTLVMMEALIGQLYTAILIARLVSLHVEEKKERKVR